MKQIMIWVLVVCLSAPLGIGSAVADDLDLTVVAQGAKRLEFTDHLVKYPEFNERMAQERDKTNDTIALVAWGLLLIIALTHGSNNGGVDDGGCER